MYVLFRVGMHHILLHLNLGIHDPDKNVIHLHDKKFRYQFVFEWNLCELTFKDRRLLTPKF